MLSSLHILTGISLQNYIPKHHAKFQVCCYMKLVAAISVLNCASVFSYWYFKLACFLCILLTMKGSI